MNTIYILIAIVLSFAIIFSLYKIHQKPKQVIHESIKCPPERIRPSRGICFISGCKIKSPHSHAEDLRRRLKEQSK
jgi:hypothetical protein